MPWWVLPAIVLSGLVGALMTRWMDTPPPAQAPAVAVDGPAAARVALAAPPPAAPPQLPPESKSPAAPPSGTIELSGVLMVAGQPAMALVSVGGGPAVLARPGDRITATAVVVGIEASAMQVRDGGRVARIEVSAMPARIAPPAQRPVSPAPPDAAAAAGVAPAPAGDAPGSGNAAFRAAIEDKVRSMNR